MASMKKITVLLLLSCLTSISAMAYSLPSLICFQKDAPTGTAVREIQLYGKKPTLRHLSPEIIISSDSSQSPAYMRIISSDGDVKGMKAVVNYPIVELPNHTPITYFFDAISARPSEQVEGIEVTVPNGIDFERPFHLDAVYYSYTAEARVKISASCRANW